VTVPARCRRPAGAASEPREEEGQGTRSRYPVPPAGAPGALGSRLPHLNRRSGRDA
jgi:hypothetical protein